MEEIRVLLIGDDDIVCNIIVLSPHSDHEAILKGLRWVYADGYPDTGIGDKLPQTVMVDPIADLEAMAIDHEYRLALLELGVST